MWKILIYTVWHLEEQGHLLIIILFILNNMLISIYHKTWLVWTKKPCNPIHHKRLGRTPYALLFTLNIMLISTCHKILTNQLVWTKKLCNPIHRKMAPYAVWCRLQLKKFEILHTKLNQLVYIYFYIYYCLILISLSFCQHRKFIWYMLVWYISAYGIRHDKEWHLH